DSLPASVINNIFSFLGYDEYHRCRGVCERWAECEVWESTIWTQINTDVKLRKWVAWEDVESGLTSKYIKKANELCLRRKRRKSRRMYQMKMRFLNLNHRYIAICYLLFDLIVCLCTYSLHPITLRKMIMLLPIYIML